MRYLLCLVGFGMLISPAKAELIYLSANSVYTQNFDSLPTSGSGLAWTNDTTIGGWYSTSTKFNASSGSSSNRTLYSFGSDGNSERALGIVSQGTSTDPQFALAVRNDTGATLNSFSVGFDGEQWRRSTTNIDAPQTLLFGYRTSSSLGAINSDPYTDVAGLGFTSPKISLPGGPLDGNDSANRTSNISGTVAGLDWKQGEYLWLRWQNESNGLGSRHGLAIDNFSFSAAAAPGNITAVPEPSSVALLLTAGGLALFVRKRSKIGLTIRSTCERIAP
jgi:hypothetical protein